MAETITHADIDAAIPVNGEPNRGKTNKLVKEIVDYIGGIPTESTEFPHEVSYMPTSGSLPIRSVENENFTGGRIKAAPGTDPEDVPVMAQLPSFARRSVVAKPETPESTGSKGDYYMDEEAIYICIAANTWRMIQLLSWSD